MSFDLQPERRLRRCSLYSKGGFSCRCGGLGWRSQLLGDVFIGNARDVGIAGRAVEGDWHLAIHWLDIECES